MEKLNEFLDALTLNPNLFVGAGICLLVGLNFGMFIILATRKRNE
jgi:hypothetical protein